MNGSQALGCEPGTEPGGIQRQVKHGDCFQERQSCLERDGSQSLDFRGNGAWGRGAGREDSLEGVG